MNNPKDNNEYVFLMHHGTHFKSVYKWIVDLGAFEHMIAYGRI